MPGELVAQTIKKIKRKRKKKECKEAGKTWVHGYPTKNGPRKGYCRKVSNERRQPRNITVKELRNALKPYVKGVWKMKKEQLLEFYLKGPHE